MMSMPVGLDARLAERIVGTTMCRLRPTPGNKILCTKAALKEAILVLEAAGEGPVVICYRAPCGALVVGRVASGCQRLPLPVGKVLSVLSVLSIYFGLLHGDGQRGRVRPGAVL